MCGSRGQITVLSCVAVVARVNRAHLSKYCPDDGSLECRSFDVSTVSLYRRCAIARVSERRHAYNGSLGRGATRVRESAIVRKPVQPSHARPGATGPGQLVMSQICRQRQSRLSGGSNSIRYRIVFASILTSSKFSSQDPTPIQHSARG